MDRKRQQALRMLGITISYYRRAKAIRRRSSPKRSMSAGRISAISKHLMPRLLSSITLLMDIADALDIPLTYLFDFHDQIPD